MTNSVSGVAIAEEPSHESSRAIIWFLFLSSFFVPAITIPRCSFLFPFHLLHFSFPPVAVFCRSSSFRIPLSTSLSSFSSSSSCCSSLVRFFLFVCFLFVLTASPSLLCNFSGPLLTTPYPQLCCAVRWTGPIRPFFLGVHDMGSLMGADPILHSTSCGFALASVFPGVE